MRRLPQYVSLLAVSVFAVGAVAVAPVYARGGSDDSSSTSTVTTENESSGSTSGTSGHTTVASTEEHSATVQKTETENENEQETTSTKDLQERAQKLLKDERQTKKTKSTEERQKACTARKDELTKRSQAYAKNAQRHLDTFNGIYEKVLAFQANKKLTATNFDQLKAAADSQKAVATAAVAALTNSDVTIDCNSTDPAAGVATLKTTVANARTALQNYRSAIKDVIVALQSAQSAANTDNTKTEANQ